MSESIVNSPPRKSISAGDSTLNLQVTDYLLNHPDFFVNHPDVLIALDIPHQTGDAISLIEQQVRVLRQRLEIERARLAHLIARAREYETLTSHLHGFVLKLLAVNDPDHLYLILKDSLLREFRADAVALKFFPVNGTDAESHNLLVTAFQDVVTRKHALCGSLDADKASILFGEIGASVRAVALIPIRTNRQSGVLAIGSLDSERFHPDMATDLLDRLGEIVSHALQALPHHEHR